MAHRYFTILMVAFALLTMNFLCGKYDITERPYEQTFQIPVDIFPLKKTYTLTDTIWIETDLPGKLLFDTKTNQSISADTGQITFGASFNEFGTYVTNPPSGFCDIVTIFGTNINRQLSQWGTSGSIDNFGCGQSSYKCRIGFKPLIKGTYWLVLANNRQFESCPNKVVPYYATLSFRFKATDLGLEIFNALSQNDKGGSDGIKFYTNKINNREGFVFNVE